MKSLKISMELAITLGIMVMILAAAALVEYGEFIASGIAIGATLYVLKRTNRKYSHYACHCSNCEPIEQEDRRLTEYRKFLYDMDHQHESKP